MEKDLIYLNFEVRTRRKIINVVDIDVFSVQVMPFKRFLKKYIFIFLFKIKFFGVEDVKNNILKNTIIIYFQIKNNMKKAYMQFQSKPSET